MRILRGGCRYGLSKEEEKKTSDNFNLHLQVENSGHWQIFKFEKHSSTYTILLPKTSELIVTECTF